MTTYKKGQIVRFHTPLADEDPEQLYIVLEMIHDVEKPRVHIQALNTGCFLSPISTVLLEDLEFAAIDTRDVIGHKITIQKSDYTLVMGIVVSVGETLIWPMLTRKTNGVETNVMVTIIDINGTKHTGTLFVNSCLS